MSFHGGFLGVVVAALWFCRRAEHPDAAAGRPAGRWPRRPGLLLGRLANFINAELWGRPTTLPWGVIFPGEAAQTCAGVAGLCARHPCQLYEAALEGLLLGVVLSVLAYRRGWLKRPGQIDRAVPCGLRRWRASSSSSSASPTRSSSRPTTRWAMHAVGGFGLTMGQLLSLPMIAGGLCADPACAQAAAARHDAAWPTC